MIIKHRSIHILALLWLSISIAIFLLAWCRWYYSIPLVLSMIFLHCQFFKELSDTKSITISKKTIFLAALIVIVMVISTGVGGYVVQPNDHYYRNSWFIDIINYDWPVYDAKEKLYMCYYFTFWLVPALFGKIFNSVDIGFFAQMVWMSIGFFLLFLEICIHVRKVKIGILFIFFFFTGWKIIECLLYFPVFGGDTIRNTFLALSINGSPGVFHAGPIVQLLYDPFNQTVPLFLAMMLLLNNRNTKVLSFIYAMVLYYAPFPFVGLLPIFLYLFIKNTDFSSAKKWLYSWMSLANIVSIILILFIGLFYLANINASHRGIRPSTNLSADIYSFILYLIFEFLIFYFIARQFCEDKRMYWIAFLSICVLGWFQIGAHNDFCFRSNMPLIFITCLMMIKAFYGVTDKWKKWLIVGVLLVGAIPTQIHPCLRYLSTYFVMTNQDQAVLNDYQSFYDIKSMYVMQQKEIRNDDFGSIFGKGPEFDWTVKSLKASPDAFFFKYIAKDVK